VSVILSPTTSLTFCQLTSIRSGLAFPFIVTALLDRYGFRATLRIWAFTMAILCAPLIYFVKGRLPPPSSTPLPRQPISYSFVKSRVFVFLQLANILESLGFFLPSIYLPSYAHSIGLSPVASIILLALLNASSVVGAISMGQLCDRMHVTNVITISTVGSTLSVFLLWGLATNFPLLVVFSITYGIFAGGFSAIWTGMMKEVQKDNTEAKLGTLMGLFSAGRGIGAVLSGPLSGLLLGSFLEGKLKFGYGAGDYGALILFTGISAFLGMISVGAKRKSP
jgi:MFS family permease